MPEYTCVNAGRRTNFSRIQSKVKPKREVSIVIPTYNEENNIRKLVRSLQKHLRGADYQIVIVDDDSKDGTQEAIDNLAKSRRIIALHRKGIRGVYTAIMDGVSFSNCETVVIMDADFSHPPEKVPELLNFSKEFDIVSGSRFVEGSRIDAPFARKYGTILLNLLCRYLIGSKAKDVTGGFHVIKKVKLKRIKFKQKAIWGEFDMELMYRASKLGYKIKEMPFTYSFRREGVSKSENLLKYGLVYTLFALKLRLSG